jgi:hypothetical protein
VRGILSLGAVALATSMCLAATANAGTILAMKVSDLEPATASAGYIDPLQDWINAGGHNEGVAGATSLTNNGIDYKNSFVDTNWGDVLSVRVSYYSQGLEVAFALFSPGTSKSDFFASANVLSSSWTDLGSGAFNHFSIAGDSGINRHWFANRFYGGCGNDPGHMVVLDRGTAASFPCAWEDDRLAIVGDPTRAFLYSTASDSSNWLTDTGIADVFAVHVNVAMETVDTPEPATLGLLAVGAVGLAAAARRRA